MILSAVFRPSSLGWQTANFNFTTTPNKSRGKLARAYNPPILRNIAESKILPLSRSKLVV